MPRADENIAANGRIRVLLHGKAASRQDIREAVKSVRKLLSEGEAAIEKRVVQARLPWVEIEADEPLHINLDGEPMNQKQYRFEIDAGSLRLHLPPDAPVVSQK